MAHLQARMFGLVWLCAIKQLSVQVKEMDEQLDRLDRRAQKLVKGSHRYKEGVGSMSAHQVGFAEALEEFCGGTDEESLLLGAQLLCPARVAASTSLY